MKRRALVAASLAAVALGGCAVHKQSMTDSYSPYYKSGSIRSVAILPSVGAEKVSGYLPEAYAAMQQALAQANVGLKIIPVGEAAGVLGEKGQGANATRLIDSYTRSGFVDTTIAKALKEALGVDAVCFLAFPELHQNNGVFFRGRGHARIKARVAVAELQSGLEAWKADTMEWFATSNFGIHKAPEFTQPMEETIKKIRSMRPAL